MNTKEIWKPVKGYEETHEVSSHGNVVRKERTRKIRNQFGEYLIKEKAKAMTLIKDSHGYYQINLNGKAHLVHRLVAEVFLEPPTQAIIDECNKTKLKKVYVNHIDENPLNNCYSNLEWCTPKYNSEYSKTKVKHTKGVNMHSNKLTEKQVLEIYDLAHNSKLSQFKIAEAFNVKQITVSNIKTGKSWCELTGHVNTRKSYSTTITKSFNSN